MSRLSGIVEDFFGGEDADDIMQEVLGALSEGGAPQVGNIIHSYTVLRHLI